MSGPTQMMAITKTSKNPSTTPPITSRMWCLNSNNLFKWGENLMSAHDSQKSQHTLRCKLRTTKRTMRAKGRTWTDTRKWRIRATETLSKHDHWGKNTHLGQCRMGHRSLMAFDDEQSLKFQKHVMQDKAAEWSNSSPLMIATTKMSIKRAMKRLTSIWYKSLLSNI